MIKYVIITLILGLITGYFNNNYVNIIEVTFAFDYLQYFSLILLLFLLGISFGMEDSLIKSLKRSSIKILLLPIAIILGSILGGLVGGLILGINLDISMAVCSGCGFYSLTGPFVSKIYGLEWGALGFSVNLLREIFTLVTVSILVKIDKYAPIASGGVTSMDTTLPLIIRYCGADLFLPSFISGFIITLFVPFILILITFFH